jgi:hypothetical protein
MYADLIVPKNRDEFVAWLSKWDFRRHVTLSFNDFSAGEARLPGSSLKHQFLVERLGKWDAHMNSKVLGREWAKRHHDRMFVFYFLEKPDFNPHWHALVRFDVSLEKELERQQEKFDANVDKVWKKLVPSGTTAIRSIDDLEGVSKYVAKSLPYELSSFQMVTPDAFARVT